MNKSVIVTGSEGLIGKQVVSFLKSNGWNVIRCSRSLGHDLMDERFVKQWFQENKAETLVNLFALNEHIEPSSETKCSLFDITLDSVRDFLETNVTALFSVCREYAANNDCGHIINFSSIYGLTSPDPRVYVNGQHKHVGYATSKAAVLQLTKYLAVHLAPTIRVNCIVPGGIKHNQGDEFQDRYSKKCPLNRMMNVHEINGIIQFLCSDSSYCTGGEYILDGGYTSW